MRIYVFWKWFIAWIKRYYPPPPPPKPAIWCYSGWRRDAPESVKLALDSGKITHVAFLVGSRFTSDSLSRPETVKAIEIAKKYGAKLIIVRFLWPTQPMQGSQVEALVNPQHYVDEIGLLRDEAERIGAQYVALDTEAYGPTDVHDLFKSKTFTKEYSNVVRKAIDAAISLVGKVDFILPAGSARTNHPLMAIAHLGKQRITEGTYYDIETDIRYPYEITGMYVNTTKTNETHAHLQYFLPSEVFGSRKDVWQSTEGLFVWPMEGRALEVARALLEFSRR